MENKDNKQAHEHEAQKANQRTTKQELTEEQLKQVAGGGGGSVIEGFCSPDMIFNLLHNRCEPR